MSGERRMPRSAVRETLDVLRAFGLPVGEGERSALEETRRLARPPKPDDRWPFLDTLVRASVRRVLYVQPDGLRNVGEPVTVGSVVLDALRSTFPDLERIEIASSRPEIFVGEADVTRTVMLPTRENGLEPETVFPVLEEAGAVVPDLVLVGESLAVANHAAWRSDAPGEIAERLARRPLFAEPWLMHMGYRYRLGPELKERGGCGWTVRSVAEVTETSAPRSDEVAELEAELEAAEDVPWQRAWRPESCHRNRMIATLGSCGFLAGSPPRYLDPTHVRDAGRDLVESVTGPLAGRRVVVAHTHSDAQGGADLLPEWTEVSKALGETPGIACVLTAGRGTDPRHRERLRAIREELEGVGIATDRMVLPPMGIDRLKGVLATASAVVAAESGPALLAEAMRIPTVVWATDRVGDGYLHPDADHWRVLVVEGGPRTSSAGW
jgi:hypothetical protein